MILVKKRNPLALRSFNHIADELLNNLENTVGYETNRKMPSVNISKDEHNFYLEIAAPGLIKDDFKITVEKLQLTVSTQKEKKEAVNYKRKEFSYDKFKRVFDLPQTADAEKISANYQNGILQISMPKKAELQPKTISIN
ncbi:MAG: Hsp20/alpha crystallin family protein [Bacteroidota bacterium]